MIKSNPFDIVCEGWYNKILQTGQLINNENLLLQVRFLRLGSARARQRRSPFLEHGWGHPAVSSRAGRGQGGQWITPWGLYPMTLLPPKGPISAFPHLWGLIFQHVNSGGGRDTNIWAEWIFSTNILHQDCNLTPKTVLARVLPRCLVHFLKFFFFVSTETWILWSMLWINNRFYSYCHIFCIILTGKA